MCSNDFYIARIGLSLFQSRYAPVESRQFQLKFLNC